MAMAKLLVSTTKTVGTDKLEGLKFLCLVRATKTLAVDKLEGTSPQACLRMAASCNYVLQTQGSV